MGASIAVPSTEDPAVSWTARAERLLAKEAYLLDSRRLEDWVELFTADGIYWVPLERDALDPGESLNIAFEGRPRLMQRVARLRSGLAHAQEPPSSTVRGYSSVYVAPGDATETTALVHSALHVVEARLGEETLVAARCDHRLVIGADGGTYIALKRVWLVNASEAQHDLSFIL